MREIKNLSDGLGQLREGEQSVELRFVNQQGETEVWILKGANVGPNRLAGLTGATVWKAYIDDGVDSRLGLQREIIERLYRHLDQHHDNLGTKVFGCGFEEE